MRFSKRAMGNHKVRRQFGAVNSDDFSQDSSRYHEAMARGNGDKSLGTILFLRLQQIIAGSEDPFISL
ncbi:MAG TPA: hypothetical protein DCY38_00130 [Opitutae bacterium]|nr:hypothetical protein [Opitutae bacterium]